MISWRRCLHHIPQWYQIIMYRPISGQVLHGRGTIFALSSGHGKAGVAVIRVSGPSASESLIEMVRNIPPPRKASLRKIYYPATAEAIDNGLILWFPGPDSFTGEDCAEFQVHGGSAVVSAVLTALSGLPGFRHAEAGEFTKRAFMNGRLDLTEVEGLSDLIAAETEAQRRQALRQMQGDLGDMYSRWRRRIIKCLANVEAYIDFSEDENIEDDVLTYARKEVDLIMSEMKGHLRDNRRGERLRSGVQVAIIGEPNVGKSSLLNSLCQRPAAIVSPIPGTTRDVVETALNIGGYPVLLSDTAGLRETKDVIEKEGVRRAIERAQQADVKILLVDASAFASKDLNPDLGMFIYEHLNNLGLTSDQVQTDISVACDSKHKNKDSQYCPSDTMTVDSNLSVDSDTILVFNKCDLVPRWIPGFTSTGTIRTAVISCSTGNGVTEFVQLLAQMVQNACGNPLTGNPSLTQTRHRHHLTLCVGHLESFLHIGEDVMAAQQLHKASRELGKISGVITSEDILDVIFKDFCIGK